MTIKSDKEIKTRIKEFKARRSEAKKYKDDTEEQYYEGAICALEWILYGKEIE